MRTTASGRNDASAEPESYDTSSKPAGEFGLRFGSKARCAGAFEGRVVRVTLEARSCRMMKLVLRTLRPAHDYVIPAELAERGTEMWEINCTVPGLTQYKESSAYAALPVTCLRRQYPAWQPFQQIQQDLQNPFGRVVVGPRRLIVQPGEIELSQRQLIFGTDGLLGTLEGVVTTRNCDVIGGLLVVRTNRRNRRASAVVPIERVADWETMDMTLTSRELQRYDSQIFVE